MHNGLNDHLQHADIAPVLPLDYQGGFAAELNPQIQAEHCYEAPDAEIYVESASQSLQDMTLPKQHTALHFAAHTNLHVTSSSVDAAGSKSKRSSMDGMRMVCAWDLDETLIIFNSLLNGSYHAALAADAEASHGMQPLSAQACKRLGEGMADIIFTFLDNHFMFPLVENLDPMHLSEHHTSHSAGALHDIHHRNSASAAPQPYAPQHHAPVPHHNQPPPHPHHMQLQIACSSAPAAITSPRGNVKKRNSSELDMEPGSSGTQAAADAASAAPDCTVAIRDQQGGEQAAEVGEQGPCTNGSGPALKRSKSCVEEVMSASQVLERVAHMYTAGFDALPLSEKERARILAMRTEVDKATGGWLSSARALLLHMSEVGTAQGYTVHHCIVTTGQLVASLGKLLLFGLGDLVPADYVYSASKQTKLAVFKKLRARWGISTTYLAAGDGSEERKAAAQMRWPFVQLSLTPAVQGVPSAAGPDGAGSSAHDPPGMEEEKDVELPSTMVYPAAGCVTIKQLSAEVLLQHAIARARVQRH